MQSGMDQDLIFIIELGFKIAYDDLTKLLPKHCRPLGTSLTIINSCFNSSYDNNVLSLLGQQLLRVTIYSWHCLSTMNPKSLSDKIL